MDRFSVLLGVAQTASQQHDPAELEDALSATRHIRHRRRSLNSGGCKPVRHASRHQHLRPVHLTTSATSAAPPQVPGRSARACGASGSRAPSQRPSQRPLFNNQRTHALATNQLPTPGTYLAQTQTACTSGGLLKVAPLRISAQAAGLAASTAFNPVSARFAPAAGCPQAGSMVPMLSPAGQPPSLGEASTPGLTPCATLPAPGMRAGAPAQQGRAKGPKGEHTATTNRAATFTNALVPTIDDVCSSILQITFCVAVKEARIARNGRRILQYLLNNLMRGQATTVESVIRRDFGNTPNTSKSLRLLVSSRTLARAGQGGRVDAFRYSIPSDVLAVIAPGGIGALRGAAAANLPPAGMGDAAGPSGAVRDPVISAGITPGAQATPCGDLAPPNAPAKRSPAERFGPCSPVFSKTRARAAFAAAALQTPEAAAATAMHPLRQATGMQSPSRASKRKADTHSRSEHPRKRAAAAALSDADQCLRENSAPCPGPLQLPGGAGALPQEVLLGGKPLAPPVNIGLEQAAASPKLSAAESIGSDPGQPASSDGRGMRPSGKLRFTAGEALGPWRGQGSPAAAGHVTPATGAGNSGGMADSSPLPARALGNKENLPAGLETSLKHSAGKAAAQGSSPARMTFRPSQHADSSAFPAMLPATSMLEGMHQPATNAKEPALLEAMGRMAAACAPLPAPLSTFCGHSDASEAHACPPLFCTPPLFCPPVEPSAKYLSAGAAANTAGAGDAVGLTAKPVPTAATAERTPLADMTLAASNAPPDTAHGSQGMDSAATAAPAGAWGV